MQQWIAVPAYALAWLGGQGTRAIAALVFIGSGLPPLGAILKPFVTEAIFALCISFMRVDLAALRDHLRRPGLVVAATAKAGPERAFALSLMVSQRNTGLMLAANEGALPGATSWLYFAMSQFPICLSPQLLRPLADRLQNAAASAHGIAPPRDAGHGAHS